MSATHEEMVAELRRANAALLRERDENAAARDAALAREAALAEVLELINRSPANPRPVLEAILEKARALCGAEMGTLASWDGEFSRVLARHGYSDEIEAFLLPYGQPFRPGGAHVDVLRDGKVVHILDQADPSCLRQDEDAGVRAFVERSGTRTWLSVPLLGRDGVIGSVNVARGVVRAFSDPEIALLQSFAAQAVIAMESARLIDEQREALERQIATAEVLQVINANPGEVLPVFDSILENAHRVCGASIGSLWLYDGELIHAAATRGMTEEAAAQMRRPRPPSVAQERLTHGRARYYHSAEHKTDNTETNPEIVASGAQTIMGVPLVKDGRVIGIISARRLEGRPFSEREIELLESFAAQAVIAMENTRLITETREALEQQTATAEVLQVINANPGRLAPVFDTMLEMAMRLCGAALGTLLTVDGERLRYAAQRGLPETFAAFRPINEVVPVSPIGPRAQTLKAGHPIEIPDFRETPVYREGHPGLRHFVEITGARTALYIPLRRDSEVVGLIEIYRQDVRAFSGKEITLLENFAAQATIAMENARLLMETQDALAQQTATAEVLGVINANPGDLAPVFDAMLENALRMCGGTIGGIFTIEGNSSITRALKGVTPAFAAFQEQYPVDEIQPGTVPARIIDTRRPVQNPDVKAGETYRDGVPYTRAMVDLGNIRAVLAVPLLKEGAAVGMISLYREAPGAFADKQIALLENFAAQAVIAMENARLLTETREALEQQTATAEVLQVINASPGDLAPVFETILEKAMRLCGVAFGLLREFDGEGLRPLASRGVPAPFAEFLKNRGALRPIGGLAEALRTGNPNHTLDMRGGPYYIEGNSDVRAIADLGGARTLLHVPMVKDGRSIGLFTFFRNEVRAFADKEIALLKNFAAQAVIAMENARLLTETREALEQQTATAEVLEVINANPGDLAPVFDTLLEKAMRLCGAAFGFLRGYDGKYVRTIATQGVPAALDQFMSKTALIPPQGSKMDIVLKTGRTEEYIDIRDTDLYRNGQQAIRAVVDLGGARTLLLVPLVKDRVSIGLMTFYRQEVRSYSAKEISLLENFAAQAVIAMENARLLTETREALDQQTATAEVLEVINANPGDLAPVFDAMLEKAMRLCGAAFGMLRRFDGTQVHTIASRGLPEAFAEFSARNPATPTPGTSMGKALSSGRPDQLLDVRQQEGYETSRVMRAIVELGGARTVLTVPLVKDGSSIALFTFYRREERGFSDKEIALLENFAAQAVIAMENARLLTETREALERQTATAEVLQVINANPGDVVPVFDTILANAHRVCGASIGSLWLYDGEMIHAAATRGMTEDAAVRLLQPRPPSPVQERMIRERSRYYHSAEHGTENVSTTPEIVASGVQTIMAVPLVKDGRVTGIISARRFEARPFSEREIELLESFAAQAVIAMENARLLTETREALEQQTATAEVLGVINASPGNLGPVFDSILEKSLRICRSEFGALSIFDGSDMIRHVSERGVTPALAEFRANASQRELSPNYRELIETRRPVHQVDMKEGASYRLGHAGARATVDLGGARTLLIVPLLKDNVAIGAISIYRREVRAFSAKEIALLENFAAQAVIAMENARLLDELRQRTGDLQESLTYQTATADVLKVISRSTFDLNPVLETLLTAAARLCDADRGGIAIVEGDGVRVATHFSRDGVYRSSTRGQLLPLDRATVLGRTALEGRIIHIEDVGADAEHVSPNANEPNLRGTMLGVPLLRGGTVLGSIRLHRLEVRPFTQRQIELVSTFADQAVIAIENTRLLTEQREALEQQTATADVLGVINASPGELAPVFDAMLEKGMRLCDAAYGILRRFENGQLQTLATRGVPEAYAAYNARNHSALVAGTSPARALATGRPAQTLDVREGTGYKTGDPAARAVADLGGARSMLHVPLVKDRNSIGLFSFYRQDVRAFSDKQIALLENFAAQAVIAMENARLITETREALEQQTATAELLSVINENPGDLAPVFDAMLEKAMRLCGASFGGLNTWDGEYWRPVATRGYPPAFDAYQATKPPPSGPPPLIVRMIETKRTQQIADLMTSEGYRTGHPDTTALVTLGLARTGLFVPLVKDGVTTGNITVYRQEVRPFSDKDIALLENFAAQAVIAMENARLLTETREALEQQTATADVLGVINASPGELTPVFDAILEKAMRLCNGAFGLLFTYVDGRYVTAAQRGLPPAFAAIRQQAGPSVRPGGNFARLADTKRPIQILDLKEGEGYRIGHPDPRALVDVGGARTVLWVPLVKDDDILGIISIYRQHVEGFSDKEVALLENFAAQAVIAMENARLIDEIRAARDNAEATLQELKIAQANLIQAEKMASLGQLTAGIAHEIKNPLNFVNNFAILSVELLAELKDAMADALPHLGDDRRDEVDEVQGMLTSNLEKITEHGKRADSIVRAMLEHSRGASGERRAVDINGLADEALNLAYHGARAQDQSFNITLERNFGTDMPPIELNPQDITRVFLNLFANGFYAANKRARDGGDPTFQPTLTVTTRDLGDVVEVLVRDNGTGIPAEIRDKLFQPFFTTKPTGEGTGLGLSITYDIITKQHGGAIAIDSAVNGFTEFTVKLPRRPWSPT